jgi:non-specific serine/threonine protein kinase
MASLQELIASFRSGQIKLPAVFDALTARRAVSPEEHARDAAWLEHLRDEEGFAPRIARALLAKLASTQPASASPVAVEDLDAETTRVLGIGPFAAAGDATRVAPVPPTQDDGTLVRPRPVAGDADESATVVQPASRPTPTQTQGTVGSDSSLNASTWQRVAGESGGEYATVGMLLKGRFLLERELGRGGMGVVYLARDERKVEARDRDPYVAVKVLNDEFRRHPDSLIALQREARRSQQLAHDNIVRVYDFDKDGTIVFMTMEYIDGTSLKTLIREEAFDGMPLAKARPLIEGMAWALKRAHTAGVVHSDFKPGNVMVTRAGVPKVLDFGIARAGKFVETAGEETVFDAGTLGALTPAYASLEMLRGAEPQPTDDIYALGCVAYELLTGKHPFDKVSAEVALKEGRKPPRVQGLTKRQNKTLADAVAFHGEQRLHNVLELIEGLRNVTWRERSRPLVIYGVAAAVVLALAGYGVSRYLGRQRVANVVDRFAPDNPQRYASEDQAYDALTALGDDESPVVVKYNNVITSFLLNRLDAYWNPEHKRFDYAGVRHVFQVRDKLKLFSPQLDVRRSAIDQQRNGLLNTLDTQLGDRTAAGALFENQPDNVVETLAAIRAIDPHSTLLDNAELKLKYDIAIGQSLDAGHLDEAKQRLALATRLFPQSKRLQQRAAQLATQQQAAAATGAALVQHTVPEARQALQRLATAPSLAPEWQAEVDGNLRVLQADHTPATQQLLQTLAGAIAEQAAKANTPAQVQRAAALVALGLQHVPASKPLLAQRDRLAALQAQAQAQLAAESSAAEVDSRINSLKRAAAAHDIGKAEESLARIRTLQPGNPFLKKDGPQLLAEAYLGEARSLVENGKYKLAADTLAKGVQTLGQRTDLRNARARMVFVADVMRTRGRPVGTDDIRRLRERLASLDKTDRQGLDDLQDTLKVRGALPEGSFAKWLDGLKPSVATSQPASTLPATSAAPTAPVVEKPPAAPRAGAPTAAAPTPAAPAAAPATPIAQADPCARSGLAGRGRVCADHVGSGFGPALVVIPASAGKAFAMSRTEITTHDFNEFCSATHQCTAKGGSGNLPVDDIGLAQAKAYTAWLTQVTGYTYRLPTDAEWLRAAKAGQDWNQAPDSNCIPPSAGADGGVGGPIAARGRQPNPWGLVNMTGNVWEWVISGGQVMVRGGSYNNYWSECTVATQRGDNGSAQKDVGFRVLRELK